MSRPRHGAECRRRFGPLGLWDAEAGEHSNGTIRNHIINSNRHNISKDVTHMWAARDAVQVMLDGGGGGIGPALAEFVRQPLKAADKTFWRGSGVCWRDDNDVLHVGVVHGRCPNLGEDGTGNKIWLVDKLVKTNIADEVLVGYRQTEAHPVRVDGDDLYSCDLHPEDVHDQSGGPGMFWRNIMFHDDIIERDEHERLMVYLSRVIEESGDMSHNMEEGTALETENAE